MFQSLQQGVLIVGSWLVFGFALWRGRWPERATVVVMALSWLIGGRLIDRTDWDHVQPALLVLDLITFAFFCGLVWKTDRRWPVFAALFQLQTVLTHVAMMLGWDVGGWLYVTSLWIWFALVVLALAAGTFLEAHLPRRRARLSGSPGTSE